MLKRLELSGFKSFARKTELLFETQITAIVGPNGSGKSNIAESFRWGLGEQSLKSLRGKRGEDLIFNGAAQASRLNRAAVAITFDNRNRRFPLDYDEVTITREVFRDGTNEYSINGTKVRLKDVYELLSSVSLGSTGHHIINQGEADRILNANIYERRLMIEEALGLRLYQWKIEESERKLTKTEDNIKQVESLRREIAPHLKFLHKQVEKLEKADALRRELKTLYFEYLKKEEHYLQVARSKFNQERSAPAHELAQLEEKLQAAEAALAHTISPDHNRELLAGETEIRKNNTLRDDLARQLGRLEGIIEIKGEKLTQPTEVAARVIDYGQVDELLTQIDQALAEANQTLEAEALLAVLTKIKTTLAKFRAEHRAASGLSLEQLQTELADLQTERQKLVQEMDRLVKTNQELEQKLAAQKLAIEKEKEATRGAEREIFEWRSRRSELRSRLDLLQAEETRLNSEEVAWKEEVREALTLVDQEIKLYEQFVLPADYNPLADRTEQEDRRRQIERIKIRLEDMGVEGTDVLEEYKVAQERDTYLEREHHDLLASKEDLRVVIKELREKLDLDFKEGIIKINQEFKKFFGLMFGGGTAELEVLAQAKKRKVDDSDEVDESLPKMLLAQTEEEEVKEGIDIAVSLPRKKIKGLQMLSGGERALTSIALLFAMSQVNPPPFLILDETDAALDEANSRKYGDMIENLSKYSQLILITHNRETMSRAGVIYGVTMGSDGISKLLSIKFDEAETYAK